MSAPAAKAFWEPVRRMAWIESEAGECYFRRVCVSDSVEGEDFDFGEGDVP